ncbi:MAG: hypothetical protein MZV64_26720 [Ignavibacteriales bacterium]|nr:hypothetical protein [Ignavibacteriales bacterium]
MGKVDLASVIGILIGLLAIFGVQMLESNSLSTIIQPTAAIIVFEEYFQGCCNA